MAFPGSARLTPPRSAGDTFLPHTFNGLDDTEGFVSYAGDVAGTDDLVSGVGASSVP
jgi:hypothetical protein